MWNEQSKRGIGDLTIDEKIKEMRTDIGIAIHNAKQDYWYIEDDFPYWIAESLIQKGYRKESDTAREILQMIDSIPTNEVNELNHLRLLKKAIAEKYGVDLD